MSGDMRAAAEGGRSLRPSLLALLPAVLFAGALLTGWTVAQADREMREALLAKAAFCARVLAPEPLHALAGTSADLSSPVYLRLKDQLAALRATVPLCRFFYLLGQKPDGTLFFFADSEPAASRDLSPPGQLYEEASAVTRRVFSTGAPAVDGPFPDRWGTWVSALAPVGDPRPADTSWGRDTPRMVLGLDIDATDWRGRLVHAAVPPAALTLALGLLVGAGSALRARRRRGDGPTPLWLRHLEPGLAAVAGLLLTGFAAWTAHDREEHRRREAFSDVAASRTLALSEALHDICDSELEGLAGFYEGSDDVADDEFARYTRYLVRNPLVLAWGWTEPLAAADPGRAARYPVLCVAPTEGNQPALGRDLGAEPSCRRAFEEGVRTGLPAAALSVPFVPGAQGHRGLLLCRPVFAHGHPERLRGFALASVPLAHLLRKTGSGSSALLELAVLREDGTSEALAVSWDGGRPPSRGPSELLPVTAFGRVFAVTSRAGPGFLRSHPARAGLVTAAVGLALTGSLAALLSAALRRRHVLEELVRRRTRELERLNRLYRALCEVDQAIVRGQDRDTLFREICRVLVETGGFRLAWVGWGEPGALRPEPAAHWGDHLDYLAAVKAFEGDEQGGGAALAAVREGRTFVDGERADGGAPLSRFGDFDSFLGSAALPVRLGGESRGALLVYAGEPGFFGANEVSLLEGTASDLSFALEHLESEEQRRSAEGALRASEERYRNIVETQLDFVNRFLPGGVLTYVNNSLARFSGIDPQELLGTSFYPFLHEGDRAATVRAIEALTPEDPVKTVESRIVLPDGKVYWHQWTHSALVGADGTIVEYQGVGRDLTERKRLEAEKEQIEQQLYHAQKMEAIGTLASGIAHDFNNILTPILAHAEMALMKLADADPVKDNVSQVVTAAERAAALVRQILELSRREEGQSGAVGLAPLVKEVAKFVRASLPTSIDIKTHVDAGCGPVVGDVARLHQVLLNLCTNARDAMQERGGVLTLSLERAPSRRLRLAVGDTGTGIPPELVGRIFEPYFTTKAPGKGTGLGLATVHAIVEAMGGEIRVQSEPGWGTTFEVFLPEAERELPLAPEKRNLPRGNLQRVLVVDDEPEIVSVLERMLDALGYRPVLCGGSLEALAVFREDPQAIDVVFTDYTMPDLNGLALVRELLRLRPELPVVLGTGFAEGLSEQALADAGVTALVVKPFTAQKVSDALHRVLQPRG